MGVHLFFCGGVADLIWHTLFGFETGVEVLLSPPHLLLFLSAMFLVSGPFGAAWRRTDPLRERGWLHLLPMLLWVAGIFSLLTLVTTFAHILVPQAARPSCLLIPRMPSLGT